MFVSCYKLVMGKPPVCERWSPKGREGSSHRPDCSETPGPFIGNIHLELSSTVSTWIWLPKMSFWSHSGYDLFLLLPPICLFGAIIGIRKIEFLFLVHLPRFSENNLLPTSTKMRLGHNLLWAPPNRLLVSGKRFSFPGRCFFMISVKHQCVWIKFSKVYICQGRFNVDSGVVLWRFDYPWVRKTWKLLSAWMEKEHWKKKSALSSQSGNQVNK